MSEAATKQLQMWIIGALLAIAGTLFSMLWNQQQGVIQQLSDRIGRMEVVCKA